MYVGFKEIESCSVVGVHSGAELSPNGKCAWLVGDALYYLHIHKGHRYATHHIMLITTVSLPDAELYTTRLKGIALENRNI